MKFVTIRERRTAQYRVHVSGGGRGLFFNNFEYELDLDPAEERAGVHFGPDLGMSCPRYYWPDIETGVRAGRDQAQQRGVRLCCASFKILFAVCHDVDTSSRAVEVRVADCIESDVATRFARIIEPFRSDWLTSDVMALARGIHSDAAFDRLPILADALQDAGCADSLVIDHLQTCPDHSPSCWVVEMILDQAATRG
jgi:hypothetical protein